MKRIILGTAGHIDHGKTALIKALTGTNTDRLKEEQKRGITIELGFAALDLPGGGHLGIVDVPGHEKFVKNMVAGATGIDMVALIIAADEGVMPQTREHLEICGLLGIEYGLVALTKVELADEELLELAKEDIQDFVQGTFLEGRPIVPVSAFTGQGLAELTEALAALSREIPARSDGEIFRLPVDRVFTMRGFGTVVTGTLIAGQVGVGDTVAVYPSGITAKVRGIQVHNQSVEQAEAGMRTAINFQGLSLDAIDRGDLLSFPDALKPSYMVDLVFHYLESNKRPLKNRVRVRFHTGTSEVLGNLILLDRDELLPGEGCVVQIRLDSPVALIKDDRYVIRSYSPVRTIGGGSVLNPIPFKHKRFKQPQTERLQALPGAEPAAMIAHHIEAAGPAGLWHSDLRLMSNLPEKRLSRILQDMRSRRQLIQTDREKGRYIHHRHGERLQQQLQQSLKAYHQAHPLKAGMPKEELRSGFPRFADPRLFDVLIQKMQKAGAIVWEEKQIRLADHQVALGRDQARVRQQIIEAYQNSGLTPPYFKDLVEKLELEPEPAGQVLNLLTEEGWIVKVKSELYFDARALKALQEKVVAFLEQNQELSTPQFKELAGVSRKYLIPLIEYFDAQKVTLRVGDIRKLRKR